MRYRKPDTKKPAIFTIGNYSDISMVEALQDAKALIRQGIDPTEQRNNEAQRVKDEAEAEARRQEQLTANSLMEYIAITALLRTASRLNRFLSQSIGYVTYCHHRVGDTF